jgi:hypothetical protein
MSDESEERITSGVIDGVVKAAKATSKAARAAEQQAEALAAFTNYTPTDKELADVPEVGIKEMIAVLSVARLGSFTKAAIQHGVSQPGLSRQVQRVEKVYGFDFFNRGSRGVPVTPKGQLVIEAFAEATKVLARSVKAVSRLS